MRGAFFGAIVADALCLGSHYEYDALKIHEAYGGRPIEKFMSPGELMGGQTHGIGWGERNYHPGKKAGGTTDYGDYNILILEHLAATAEPPRPFDVAELLPHWMNRLENSWGSWICTMTKETYAQVKHRYPVAQLGGMSNAMAIRHVAAHAYYETEEELVEVARKVHVHPQGAPCPGRRRVFRESDSPRHQWGDTCGCHSGSRHADGRIF